MDNTSRQLGQMQRTMQIRSDFCLGSVAVRQKLFLVVE